VPAKVFIINENADYFWLDRKHLKIIREFAFSRAGLAGSGAVRTLARVFSFPFALCYLLLYAAVVHARRGLRLLFRRASAIGAATKGSGTLA
jgi:succinate dehydrogenase/fumarate reductase cytochrome b subunit